MGRGRRGGFPGGSDGKESACDAGDLGSVSGLGRSPGEKNDDPLQYSYLENSMDREAWEVTVHGMERVRHYWVTNTFPFKVSLNHSGDVNSSCKFVLRRVLWVLRGCIFFPYTQFEIGHFPWDPLGREELGLFLVLFTLSTTIHFMFWATPLFRISCWTAHLVPWTVWSIKIKAQIYCFNDAVKGKAGFSALHTSLSHFPLIHWPLGIPP